MASVPGGRDSEGLALGSAASGLPAASPGPSRARSTGRRLASSEVADACYFRSRAAPGQRKALIQVTERCDLRCAHCFVSATQRGIDMGLDQFTSDVIDRLLAARVANVTLTGGEPFVHPDLLEIVEVLSSHGLDVTVCTNGVSVTQQQIDELVQLRRVRVNVSLDGYSAESHGKFRGDRASFEVTVGNTRRLAQAGLLKGILSTPNALAQPDEYRQLYELSRELGIDYLLMNPLSSFGRGFRTRSRLRADEREMERIQSAIVADQRSTDDPEAVFIRFPNRDLPLTNCIAGEVFYVFANGDTAVCPYLVFAARNPGSQHAPEEFIVANIFSDVDFVRRLDDYKFHERYSVGSNSTCTSCSASGACGKGCPAAVIASGGRIGDLDADVCPVVARVE